MSRLFVRGSLAASAAALSLSGCSLLSTVADNAASHAVGAAFASSTTSSQPQGSTTVNESAPPSASGNAAFMAYSPQMAPYYTSFLFTMAFNPGGLAVNAVPYKPGQYTRWSFTSSKETKEPSWIERAHLFDDDKGNQWWKVKFHDGGSNQTTILEGLFAPGQSRLVRLRAQFPGDAQGNEVPVDNNAYYMPARTISPESIQGATVGTDSVTVPAGNFNAKHVVFGGGGNNGKLEWWIVDTIPGGTIKQTVKSGRSGDEEHGVMVLEAYGDDAKTELGSK